VAQLTTFILCNQLQAAADARSIHSMSTLLLLQSMGSWAVPASLLEEWLQCIRQRDEPLESSAHSAWALHISMEFSLTIVLHEDPHGPNNSSKRHHVG